MCFKSRVREVLIAWLAKRDLDVATKASVKGSRSNRSGLDWPPRETERVCEENKNSEYLETI